MAIETIYHYRKVTDELHTGGQPSAAELQAAAADGVQTVINLAPGGTGTALDDEAAVVESLGMAYYHLPIAWDNPTEQDFAAFEQIMQARPAGSTLIHCAANFRVTAFYALYAHKHLGWSVAQAEEFRAATWAGSDYPVWERFVNQMYARITPSDSNKRYATGQKLYVDLRGRRATI